MSKMNMVKIVGLTSAVTAIVALGINAYTNLKAKKIKMDETVEPEVKEETVKDIEKMSDTASKVATVAGSICAWSFAIATFSKNSSVKTTAKFNEVDIKKDIVNIIREFTESSNGSYIKDMIDKGVNMHGITGKTNVDDSLSIYKNCYDKFVNTYGTGGEFVNDLSDMLNIHSVFVRNDFADAMVGGKLYA